MSAHSFITHRMFVAALSHEPSSAGAEERGPSQLDRWSDPTNPAASNFHARNRQQPIAGVLLANAMLQGYQATAS